MLKLDGQCVQEGFSEKLKEQATEGCNIAGKVRVNKVYVQVASSCLRTY